MSYERNLKLELELLKYDVTFHTFSLIQYLSHPYNSRSNYEGPAKIL